MMYNGKRLKRTCVALFAGAVVAMGIAPDSAAQTATSSPSAPGPGQEDVVGITTARPGTIDLRYRDADLQVVLRQLSAQTRKNIVTTKEVSGTISADLYGVTFEEALDAILKGAGFVYQEKRNFIYVYTPEQLEAILKAERKMDFRVFPLSYITATDAKTLLETALSSDGTIAITPAAATGIATSDSDTGGNSYAMDGVLVVRDYEENIEKMDAILSKLDVKPDQVLIEATILRATLTEDNALGIDFNTLAGVDFDAFSTTTPAVTDITTGTANVANLSLPTATWRTDLQSADDSGGFTFGLITNNIALFIRALEGVTDVTVLATPSLLIVNKQRGEVMIGNRDGYLTTTVTETVATQTVQFLETGTRLVVRPYIAKNGYIRMEVHPEDSSGSVVSVGTSVLPNESTTEVTTNLLVRDGHTIVIGGLFRERTSNERQQVPVIGNIPYVGTLFRRTADKTTREEVIILITPRIIKQEVDEAVAEQMKNDVERFRIGQRKGLQWWGRSRLSQTHMRWAKEELRRGRPDKALWNVDMALSLIPRMEEAIRLRERLTQRAYWSDQSRISGIKYIIQRKIMQDLGLPFERIVIPDKPRDPEKVPPKVREAMGIGERFEDPLPRVPAGAQGLPVLELKDQELPTDVKGDEEGTDTKRTDEEGGGNAPTLGAV